VHHSTGYIKANFSVTYQLKNNVGTVKISN